jgi:hypothetical protein
MSLAEEQKRLLADFVEADRRIPRDQRGGFYSIESLGPAGVPILHEGWVDTDRRVSTNDLHELTTAGALRSEYVSGSAKRYWVTARGLEMYEAHALERGEPVARVEKIVKEYLDADAFQKRHPNTFAKWREAEAKLWAEDSEQNLTVIGHLCREALQEFATSLIEKVKPKEFNPEPTKTVDRLRSVIAAHRAERGDTASAFDDALVAYWGTMSDLAQKQEHGSQREGRPLTWEDARRVVFHLMVVMYEIDTIVR